jgi:type I restriction enzyme, S subunit
MQVRFEKYVDFVKTGTSIPHISGKQIKDFECLIPSEKTVSNFDDFYNRWFLKFDNNKKQIQTLTQIRDTLLPKLMSGQIRVKN